jgi:signal transduction histidine kinase
LVLARPYKVDVTLESCEKATVSGDNYRLRQVLLNLMDNAVKYNQEDGSVTFTLQVQGDSAELSIRNTGPGIAPELASQLFDPFFRGDAAHNRTVDGCGLGLAIARWIVTAHHGTLTIASQPGGMTVATLQLPVIPAKNLP